MAAPCPKPQLPDLEAVARQLFRNLGILCALPPSLSIYWLAMRALLEAYRCTHVNAVLTWRWLRQPLPLNFFDMVFRGAFCAHQIPLRRLLEITSCEA